MPRKPMVTIQDDPFEEETLLDPVDTKAPLPTPPAPAPRTVSYRSRIHIVDAWQYDGNLREAPDFIDRNWAAYADYDDSRGIPPGPALRVPTPGTQAEKLARPGDYVVRQTITLAEGLEPEQQVDVWTREEFERFFLPTSQKEPADADAAQVP